MHLISQTAKVDDNLSGKDISIRRLNHEHRKQLPDERCLLPMSKELPASFWPNSWNSRESSPVDPPLSDSRCRHCPFGCVYLCHQQECCPPPSISFYISPLHIPYGSPKRREDSINFSKGCRYWEIACIHSPCHRNRECRKCRLCRRSPTVIYKSCALRIGTQPSRLLQTISRVLKAIPMTPDRYPVDYSVCCRFFRTYGSEYAKLITKFLFSVKIFSKH